MAQVCFFSERDIPTGTRILKGDRQIGEVLKSAVYDEARFVVTAQIDDDMVVDFHRPPTSCSTNCK